MTINLSSLFRQKSDSNTLLASELTIYSIVPSTISGGLSHSHICAMPCRMASDVASRKFGPSNIEGHKLRTNWWKFSLE
ncbi:hypothetical protein LguiA_022168 [Lonicera macranthoides]